MWRRHLKTIAFLSVCVCCLTARVFTFGQGQDNVTRKTSGNLSALLKATPTPTPTIPTSSPLTVSQETGDLDPRLKQRELLPLRFVFRTTSVPSFSEPFRRFVPAGTQSNVTDVGTQLISIAAASDAPARAAVDAQEVITIEIARPQTLGPIMTVGARNLGARRSHHVEEFNGEFPNVNGGNVTAVVIDEGGILNTHVEFRVSPTNPTPSRVRVNTSVGAREHPTHVAGTMAATGLAPKAKGMAPLLNLVSDDWDNDLTKLAALASEVQISNHSYGPISGWYRDREGRWYWFGDRRLSGDEDAKFGKYSSEEAQLDEVLFRFPNLITFIAAGNDRDDGPPIQPIQHFVIEGVNWVPSFDVHRADGFDQGGLDTVAGLGLSKNAICIGAVDDITSTSGINMISYSGWGPADDGRIKPDLVANGHILNSTSNAGDNQYVDMSGTSMASPTAAGITSLIVELYQRERDARPSAAEIKGILIHTATDAGRKGPDATFGWGSIDALRAGRVVAQKTQSAFRHLITTDAVNAGATREFLMNPNGTGDPIKVTLVWTDPAGAANLGGLDDATPALVNDLDLKLISPDGEEYFPYSLDRATPSEQARRDKPNKVDNVEVIEGVGALNGQWKVQVRGTNLRQGPNQRFALIVSGLRLP